MTAYAVNPTKGSEDGMGWNYVLAAAQHNNIVALTRRNNRPDIEKYIKDTEQENCDAYSRISFLYFDWPKWMLFWKKGPMLSMIYYYLWQISLVIWLKSKKLKFDLVHNLNFHNDWTPSFLWLLNKPFVWGPVGHHPRIPKEYIKEYGRKEYVKDRALWAMKWCFWNLDPLLYITRKKADSIWCMHEDAATKLRLNKGYFVHPSIAAKTVKVAPKNDDTFTVLSVGRFVPLKGFDITVKAFSHFYKNLSTDQQKKAKLVIIGKGPFKQHIKSLIAAEGIEHAAEIVDWMPQDKLTEAYNAADAFLYPSHEGAGMVVAEALRYNTPVVCWNNIGPGVIVHPDSKLKVNYGSCEASIADFAIKLNQLYQPKNDGLKEEEPQNYIH